MGAAGIGLIFFVGSTVALDGAVSDAGLLFGGRFWLRRCSLAGAVSVSGEAVPGRGIVVTSSDFGCVGVPPWSGVVAMASVGCFGFLSLGFEFFCGAGCLIFFSVLSCFDLLGDGLLEDDADALSSARQMAGPFATAMPMPRATASAPTRPMNRA
ncbi:hypothetical protein A5630_06675 [Mycolicibacterium mucogenicum]|uniref:Uncharacterized protein n=1 Tax=Mycolicibacterium mucogenicum TaxID=56689 RepID=A0A1A3GLK4_MYCMU|nr:hypothetical protein A5630_06675 [Mycolicibacterium mucogenicum]